LTAQLSSFIHSSALVALTISCILLKRTQKTADYRKPTSIDMKVLSALLIFSVAAISSARILRVRQANSQSFTGALGGIAATPILDSGNDDRPFQVKGDTFVNIGAALQRSCDQQFNACANAANSGNDAFSTQECQAQKGEYFVKLNQMAADGRIDDCAAAGAAARRSRLRV